MPLIESIVGLLPAVAALGSAVSGSKFVQEGQRGLKLRFGRVIRDKTGMPKVIRPGFVFVIPAIEHLVRTHIRTRTINLPTQTVVLSDRTVFDVSAVVVGHVNDTNEDVYKALFETDGLERAIEDYVAAELREVLTERDYERVVNPGDLMDQVSARIHERLASWGFVLQKFMLSDCSPSPQSAAAILLAAEAAFRVDALNEAAEKLSAGARAIDPQLGAALVGTPVATALSGKQQTVTRVDLGKDDEDD